MGFVVSLQAPRAAEKGLLGGRVWLASLLAAVPAGWHAPPGWLGHESRGGQPATGAWCVHEHEGSWVSIGYDRGGRALYGGGLQFLVSTWNRAGGAERTVYEIARTTPRVQLYRAWLVWKRDGGSWREWPNTARACGLL